MIEQPARCRHQYVDTASQLVDLRVNLDPAKHHGRLQRQVTAVGFDALLYLCSQLAGRCQYQCAHGASALAGRSRAQSMQQGQGKAGGLAGTGLGAGHDILAVQNQGDGLELNGCGFGVALLVNRAQEFGRQAEGIK